LIGSENCTELSRLGSPFLISRLSYSLFRKGVFMKEWIVRGTLHQTLDVFVIVTADTQEEALKLAKALDPQSDFEAWDSSAGPIEFSDVEVLNEEPEVDQGDELDATIIQNPSK